MIGILELMVASMGIPIDMEEVGVFFQDIRITIEHIKNNLFFRTLVNEFRKYFIRRISGKIV